MEIYSTHMCSTLATTRTPAVAGAWRAPVVTDPPATARIVASTPAPRAAQLPMSERAIAFAVTTQPGTGLSTGAKKRTVNDPPRGIPPRSRPA